MRSYFLSRRKKHEKLYENAVVLLQEQTKSRGFVPIAAQGEPFVA